MEANLQSNFNVGFTNMRSDVLIHLTQWQYWWWFWFSLLWAFYYLMVIKMVRFRSLKFRPRIATTFRPHGKWGDLIVCVIPVSWCANIITNSNFILRMIEWQSESGLINVRIRGKQWYWVYKFELKTFTDIFTVPKNIGHNKWQISTPNDLQVADDYLHIIQLRSQNRWAKSYWEELTKEVSKSKNFHLISPQEQLRFNFFDYVEVKAPTLDDMKLDFEMLRYDITINDIVGNPLVIKELSPDLIDDFIFVLQQGKVEISREKLIGLFQTHVNNNPNDPALDDFYNFIRVFVNIKDDTILYETFDDYLSSNLEYKSVDGKDFVDFSCPIKKGFFFLFCKLIPKTNFESVEDGVVIYKDLSKLLYDYASLTSDFENCTYLKFEWLENSFELYYKRLTTKSTQIDFFKFLNGVSKFEDFCDDENYTIANQSDWFLGDSAIDFDLNFDFKRDLGSSDNENFYIRLLNKKSNWDEFSELESTDDSFKHFLSNEEIFAQREHQINVKNFFFTKNKTSNPYDKTSFYNYSDFNEFDKFSRKSQGTNSPVRLIKYPISNKTNFDFNSEVVELFRFRYNESDSTTSHRPTPNSTFLIIRQKRYKRRKVILPRTIFYKDSDGNPTKKAKSSNYTFLNQNKIILENDFNATKRYKFFKKNKVRDELTNLVLSKRILRTRRTLVLPAHLNITAITNSFDVIHSWFIPGLGLKMDAIPGRATHHTFYIDNVGFYYGQCAEICGRYHHHMPIRICALPFEHFLLWWQSFGLPKLLFTKNFRRYSYSYGSRKYAW